MRTLILIVWSLLAASSICAQTWVNYPATKGQTNYAYETPYGQLRGVGYYGQSISADFKYLYKSFDKDTGTQGFTIAPDGVYQSNGTYTYAHDSNGSLYALGGTYTNGRFFTKLHSNGAVALHTLLDLGWFSIFEPTTLKILSNGDLLYSCHYINTSKVYRIDTTGTILWEAEFGDFEFAQHDIQELPNGDLRYAVLNSHAGPDLIIHHLQADGSLVDQFVQDSVTNFQINNLKTTEDGVLLVTNNENYFDSTHVLKYSFEANLLWDYKVKTYVTSLGKEVLQMQQNRIAVIGQSYGFVTDSIFVTILDTTGTIINHKTYKMADETTFKSIQLTQDGGLLIAGKSHFINTSAPDIPFLLKTDSLGESATQYIHGILFQDYNDDCNINAGDYPMTNWLVGLVNGVDTTYHSTNNQGQYIFLVNAGSYELTVQLYTPFFDHCSPQTIVDVPPDANAVAAHLGVKPLSECPYLTIDITAPLLRRCYTNTYHASYFNQGSDTAFNAYVEIQFDRFLTVNGANLPYTDVGNNTVEFDIGNVPPGGHGSFSIYAYLNCDSTVTGMTHCVAAHIYPDTLCLPPDPQWSEASLALDGFCDTDTDSVRFVIANQGQGPMNEHLEYIVIEDDIIMNVVHDTVQLDVGQQFELSLGSNGSTWRVNVDQVDFHPGQSHPTLAIEGCGTDTSGMFSTGYVTMFPEDEQDHFVAKECKVSVSSFDPNAKASNFIGYREQHYIEANQPLEYTIYFQNVGTDTAFTVVIYDELSPFLDHQSIQPSLSSHPYTFELQAGGIAKFTFADILLPDSTTNEAGSNGFVKFNIDQVPDNPVHTLIKNNAAIYFDFNDPVITNTVFHTIGEDFIEIQKWTSVYEALEVELLLFPNPWAEEATLILKGMSVKEAQLQVFSVDGRFEHVQEIQDNFTRIQRNALNPGLYYFRIVQGRRTLGTGQFVIAGE